LSAPPHAPPDFDPEQIEEIFGEALERPPAERRAFIVSRCGGSEALLQEVESLLHAHEAQEGAAEFLATEDNGRRAALLDDLQQEHGASRVGPYVLLRELGRGGMGIVHLAERAEGGFRQQVAIKLVKRGMDSDAIVSRFLRERQILASLDHPNLARLLEGGATDEGQPWFAMELVEGEPLTVWCESRAAGLTERLRLFVDACRVVHYAHGRMVIHRDIKPGNMMVTPDGRLKLLDFGVAKLLADEPDDAGSITRTGLHPRTPAYAAPEQVRGGDVTTATDVYGLGLVLFELVTGRRPYAIEGRSDEELERLICETDPPLPSSVAAGRPWIVKSRLADLDAVILKALRKEPERRYSSAEAFALDVERILSGRTVEARPDSVGYRASRFVGRHRVGVAASAAAALALVAGLIGTAWQAMVASRERDRARVEAERALRTKEFLSEVFRASNPAESRGKEISARDLLERGVARVEKDLADQPAIQAELLRDMAVSFWTLGEAERAKVVVERALALQRESAGGPSLLEAEILTSMGGILLELADHPGAEKARRQALEINTALLASDDPRIASSMGDLGLVLMRQGRLDEAEPLLRGSYEILVKRLGEENDKTARSLVDLAELSMAKAAPKEAVALYSRALETARKMHGETHPNVAELYGRLGNALRESGDLAGAESMMREALKGYKELLGEEHPTVAANIATLAVLLHNKGDLAGAEEGFRDALARARKVPGMEGDVSRILGNLAAVVGDRGKLDEAVLVFTEAVLETKGVFGPDHPRLADALWQQAGAMIASGKPREALVPLGDSLRIYEATYGPEHARTMAARARLGQANLEMGSDEEAEKLFLHVIDVQRRNARGEDRTTLNAMVSLGRAQVRLRRAGSETNLRETLDLAARLLPEKHWRRGEIESIVGACLRAIGKKDDAMPLLRSGLEKLNSGLGAEHRLTVKALQRLERPDTRL
jgi:serine/threonine-protein kinase